MNPSNIEKEMAAAIDSNDFKINADYMAIRDTAYWHAQNMVMTPNMFKDDWVVVKAIRSDDLITYMMAIQVRLKAFGDKLNDVVCYLYLMNKRVKELSLQDGETE